jgi:hypothetical protein
MTGLTMGARGPLERLAEVEHIMRQAQWQSSEVSRSSVITYTNLIMHQKINKKENLGALVEHVVHITSSLQNSLKPFRDLRFIETDLDMQKLMM